MTRAMRTIRAGVIPAVIVLSALLGAALPGDAQLWNVPNLVAPEPPEISAEAWILYDDTYGQVLAENQADQRRSIASTTKILTAMVVLENSRPDEPVTITNQAASIGESEIGLVGGENPWRVEELLAALMLRSANDAAVALAQHVGGSVSGFSEMMNRRTAELGLTNSNFTNPHGLDEPEHYSTARDLLTISRAAMENPYFTHIISIRSFSLPPTPDGTPRLIVNRNDLLATYPGTLGIKTGYTGQALQTLSAVAERQGRRIYAVVLGSNQHFEDVARLFDYAFANFSPLTLVPVTSDRKRPLAGGIAITPGTDLQVFIEPIPSVQPETSPPATTAHLNEETVTESTVSTVEVGEIETTTTVTVPEPAAGTPSSVPRLIRSIELPGIGDSLFWLGNYWRWFNR